MTVRISLTLSVVNIPSDLNQDKLYFGKGTTDHQQCASGEHSSCFETLPPEMKKNMIN